MWWIRLELTQIRIRPSRNTRIRPSKNLRIRNPASNNPFLQERHCSDLIPVHFSSYSDFRSVSMKFCRNHHILIFFRYNLHYKFDLEISNLISSRHIFRLGPGYTVKFIGDFSLQSFMNQMRLPLDHVPR